MFFFFKHSESVAQTFQILFFCVCVSVFLFTLAFFATIFTTCFFLHVGWECLGVFQCVSVCGWLCAGVYFIFMLNIVLTRLLDTL